MLVKLRHFTEKIHEHHLGVSYRTGLKLTTLLFSVIRKHVKNSNHRHTNYTSSKY